MIETKEKFNYGVISKNLLKGWETEFVRMGDFKEYFEKCNSFTSYSEKSFLRSIGIPPQYYLDQPDDIKEELRGSQLEIIENSKLSGKYIQILRKENSIENCVRVDLNVALDLLERIKLQDEKKLVPVRDFIKDGYSNNFIPYNKLEKGKYNLGIFVDVPLLLTGKKLPQISKGFYYVPNEGEEFYNSLYVETVEMDINDYQNLDVFIEDLFKSLVDLEKEKVMETLKDKMLLRELDEVLLQLCKSKVISKAYVKKISKFASKNELCTETVFSVVDLLLKYDANFKVYKTVSKLRSCKEYLDKMLKEGKADDE